MVRWGLIASATTVAAAVVGTLGVRTKTTWYRALDKPAWQPPPRAFPLVWTPLYGSIAWAGSRALNAAARNGQAGTYATILGTDLAANAGWCWAFFAARSTTAGLATITALNAANVALVARTWKHDRAAAAALLPYAAWCGFATALNLSIWHRNRHA